MGFPVIDMIQKKLNTLNAHINKGKPLLLYNNNSLY